MCVVSQELNPWQEFVQTIVNKPSSQQQQQQNHILKITSGSIKQNFYRVQNQFLKFLFWLVKRETILLPVLHSG